MQKIKIQSGFTLLEILLVVVAISILAGIVLVAINPQKQFADQRNQQRWIDINILMDAIYRYKLDVGQFPDSIDTSEQEICYTNTTTHLGCPPNVLEMSVLTADAKYLVSIPLDPSFETDNNGGSGYFIIKNANNRLTVWAPFAEESATITITR